MQHRENVEAPAQKPGQPVSAALSQKADQVLEQLANLAALAHTAKQVYVNQLQLTGQIALAEWQLTSRSLTIAAALVVCFGAGLILLWGSILTLTGYLLFQLSSSVLVTTVALVLLQFGLLFWCWRSLGYLLSQVGFANTLKQLKTLVSSAKAGNKNADPLSRQTTANKT
jgi:hypothetical protein